MGCSMLKPSRKHGGLEGREGHVMYDVHTEKWFQLYSAWHSEVSMGQAYNLKVMRDQLSCRG